MNSSYSNFTDFSFLKSKAESIKKIWIGEFAISIFLSVLLLTIIACVGLFDVLSGAVIALVVFILLMSLVSIVLWIIDVIKCLGFVSSLDSFALSNKAHLDRSVIYLAQETGGKIKIILIFYLIGFFFPPCLIVSFIFKFIFWNSFRQLTWSVEGTEIEVKVEH
ncbi:hypothetical protein MHSWG343_10730 [Candidatus Mycoplasma haematohominis]|uniref:Uncharacterized protein n=1 Tax=Candidatus Mycoplasma haematohominis TaxID=1494318 RepID=A0A478FVB6_9MOLU|nr:hypothetical protein MHSWG343_10730 [Candidatus Mycoplasma haemohominis]